MVRNILLITFILLFSLSLVSASNETLVAGKIYNIKIGNETVADATVEVFCYHNSNAKMKITNSVSDGTYAVWFSADDCGDGDAVNVTARKDNLMGKAEGIAHFDNLIDLNIAVINVALNFSILSEKKIKIHCHRDVRKNCGNGVCGLNENEVNCPQDCFLSETEEISYVPSVKSSKMVQLSSSKFETKGNNLWIIALTEIFLIMFLLIIIIYVAIKKNNKA